jgi:hypothetical protein
MKTASTLSLPISSSVDSTPLGESHRRTLEALFRHPVAKNLEWNSVLALVEAIGAAEHKDNDHWVLQVGEVTTRMHQPHGKDLTATEVVGLRKFLQQAGFSASGHALATAGTIKQAKNLLVVVDHHEASIYQIGPSAHDAFRQEIKPYDPHHFLHHLMHKDQDRQAGQRAPEDPGFYAGIAAALVDADQIVVVGHGTGHSNAAHHLIEHLAAHDPETNARVVAERVVDLSSVTPAQLLEIGQKELGA